MKGAGIRTILQMVQLTRLDCAIASAGLMRMALAQAVHHCRHRSVFGKPLYRPPMMRAVLADLALDVEAAVALVFRLARALDCAAADPAEAAYARIMTPAAKYWICKLAPGFVFEAMECLGGNGYVEESLLPRLYREAPVNAIWEGSGNVMGLDVLRALKHEEDAERVLLPLGAAMPAIDVKAFQTADEASARIAAGNLALAASFVALKESVPAAIADAFLKTRVETPRGALYGTAAIDGAAAETLLQRVLPEC